MVRLVSPKKFNHSIVSSLLLYMFRIGQSLLINCVRIADTQFTNRSLYVYFEQNKNKLYGDKKLSSSLNQYHFCKKLNKYL